MFKKQGRPKPGFINEAQLDTWLDEQFEAWPDCHIDEYGEKDTWLPVGGMEEFSNSSINRNFYDNPRRMQLIDFLINQASKEIEKLK